MSDQYFEADRYREFCSTSLASLPEIVYDWVPSAEFDALLVETVRATYPPHEHERFLAHFRGLIGLWVTDQTADRPTAAGGQQVVPSAGSVRLIR